VPEYFPAIGQRLGKLDGSAPKAETRALGNLPIYVSGGTDVYVQKPDAVAEAAARNLFYDETLRGIRDLGDVIEIGASTTVTDLLESPVMNSIFPDLYKHLKLVSSTPIRNMATLAGNFVNASPIGDMTVWFLALDAEIALSSSAYKGGADGQSADAVESASRSLPLRDLYQGYKQLAKSDDEIVTAIRFKKPRAGFHFNFEKVSKRTYLDIATVNTAISLYCTELPGPDSAPEFIRSELPANQAAGSVAYVIDEAHVAAGGVAPIPLYLKETSAFLKGKEVNDETIDQANEIMQSEISPISDVRGTAEYKRLLLRQLFRAHFYEMFGT
jgi:xanthine dehydrogenase small subunit